MKKLTAVLIDAVSIQQYIFSSNQLKDNLGASYIVEKIYDQPIKTALQTTLGDDWQSYCELDAWCHQYEELQILKNEKLKVEMAFTGGGKALLLFRKNDIADIFIRSFTQNLLLEYPGLRTAVATGTYYTDDEQFQKNIENIFYTLRENKNKYIPQVELPSHGITAVCPRTGLSAQVTNPNREKTGKPEYISSVTSKKIDKYKEAKKSYRNFLNNDHYVFPEQFDQMGQKKGNNYLAIVHMDGNSMGQRFKDCSTLAEYRRLACEIKEITEKTVENMVVHLVELCEEGRLREEDGFHIKPVDGITTLPVQPIIIGGDDVTIVSHGFLGVYLAEYMMKEWTKLAGENGRELSACAGIAIIPAKYPFYRGYEMAESLCNNAKKTARKNQGTSWIDFHCPYGALSGELEQVRKEHYHANGLDLSFGPYYLHRDHNRILPKWSDKDIEQLKNSMRYLDKKWPRSKQKDLRNALSAGENTLKQFVLKMGARDLRLPGHYKNYGQTGSYNKTTPYLDVLNLIEFYPNILLETESLEGEGTCLNGE